MIHTQTACAETKINQTRAGEEKTMSKRRKKKYYGLRCMAAIMVVGALLTAGGFVLRRTVLRDLPQYDEAPYIALPMMLLQDSSPVREARERAAWEAENDLDDLGEAEFAMLNDEAADRSDAAEPALSENVGEEESEGLAELVDSFGDEGEAPGVMSVFNGSASAQTMDGIEGVQLPSLEELMAGADASGLSTMEQPAPTADPAPTTEPAPTALPDDWRTIQDEKRDPAPTAAMQVVEDERIDPPTVKAEAGVEPMATLEPVEKLENKAEKKNPVTAKYFRHTLFIGDSKTNGLQIWGRIGDAHYFCGTGFSVFNLLEKKASDQGHFKNLTLQQVLKKYKYDQIYIMLGFNESGYPYGSLMKQYKYIVAKVHSAQPKARIILHGVMHATYRASQKHSYVSVANLEKINAGLRKLAKTKKFIYYVDCNDAFCDKKGYLLDKVSSDGEHMTPKYTKIWAKEIIKRAIRT